MDPIWKTAIVFGLALTCMAISGVIVGLIVRNRNRLRMIRAARRLGGRLDPASPSRRHPAILVDLDGYLARIGTWPGGDDVPSAHYSYLEIVTPIDGPADSVLAVRRDEVSGLCDLLDFTERCRLEAESAIVFGTRSGLWTVDVLADHPSWAVLEIDESLVRVLSIAPESVHFSAETIESEARHFVQSLPSLLAAAGVEDSKPHHRSD